MSSPTRAERQAYDDAEFRIRESIEARSYGGGLANHTYPCRSDDLSTMVDFHARYGTPPSGFFKRIWWRITRGRKL